jgi:predicted nuclease of predicted toxin-antitoxin system
MSRTTVKSDENLSRAHANYLRNQGHIVDRTHDQGLSGESDEIVWRQVIAEDRFFITLDLDFSDIRKYPPGSHPGILLLRPRTRGQRAVMGLLSRVLRDFPLESLRGCLTVADERNTRVRRPSA